MNRFGCRMGPVFTLLLAAACSGEPTEPFREGVQLVADPSQLYLQVGQSKAVQVSAVDGQGNPLTFAYEVTNPGTGIDVRRDSTFLPIYVDDTTLVVPAEGERFQFVVTGEAYGITSFTVSAGGEELPITVQVVPQEVIEATVSNATPGFGETITITAPAGTRFTETSQVTVAGAATQPTTVEVAADGSTITAILPPNVASPLTLTNVVSDGAPTLTFNPQTSVIVTSPVVDSLPATLSNATPDGEPVTLTSTDPNFTFDAGSAVLVGTTPGITTGVAPDGSSITFEIAPGTTGTLNVNGVIVGGFPILLPTTAGTITVGPSAPAPKAGTDDPATAPTIPTPGAGQTTGVLDDGLQRGYDCGDIGVPCQVYKFEVPADGSYDFTGTWEASSDVGIYFLEADGVTQAGTADCDAHANGADAQPETCTQEFVAGTYYVAYVPFGSLFYGEPDPAWVQIIVTPHVE